MFDLGQYGITNQPNSYDQMLRSDPARNAPDRFRQIAAPQAGQNGQPGIEGLYADQYMTPDAIAARAAQERPHKRYDSERGVIVDEDAGSFTRLPGLPQRSVGEGPNVEPLPRKITRQNAAIVRQQLDNTTTALNAATRAAPKQPAFYPSASDSTAFVQRRDAAQASVNQLRNRADSLTGVLDKLAGQMQGTTAASAPPPPAPVSPGAAMRAELQNNRQRYENLLRNGADAADAQTALRKTNQLTVQKYAKLARPR